ncbi:protein KASH5 isoform X7 [Monodelphis domestica]|uniref:protein KASH5 isoform X7 n=1 Tax=Monodelphis domestica TaxID=13616 RepID=UPI0024E27761|nr:protein KASH5 isoform X7 [Monodelphis domestica]
MRTLGNGRCALGNRGCPLTLGLAVPLLSWGAMESMQTQEADPQGPRPTSLAPEMVLWDQPEEWGLGTTLSLEEQVLSSTFEACDSEKKGVVAVSQVLAYLEAVTGRGPQDSDLCSLGQALDPHGKGPTATVDRATFFRIMQGWIATCQLGPGLELEDEAAGEPSLPPSDLGASAQPESYGDEETEPELLATAELLSSLEELELSNRRLAGENAKLQRSVETADEGAARLGEELASLRKQLRSSQQALQFAKAVDEELEDMKSLAKSLEEKNRSLVAQARQTEKEQQQLVAEVETLQEERTNRTENLTEALEEYRATIQELKQKISHLEEQLSQSREGPEGFQDGTQGIAGGWMKLHPQSLCLEIEAIQQRQDMGPGLLNPLCGAQPWGEPLDGMGGAGVPLGKAPAEDMITGQEKSSELLGSLEEENPWLLGERDHQRASQKGMRPPDTAGCLGTLEGPQFGDRPCPDARSSPSDVALLQAIEPLVGQLPSAGRRRQRRTSWELYPTPVAAPTPRIPSLPMSQLPILGLLLVLVLLLLLSVLVLVSSGPLAWPHLQLHYFRPPPV